MDNQIVHQRICSIEGCNKKHFAKTYCHMHYCRMRKNGDPLTIKQEQKSSIRICLVDGCEKPFKAKGFCSAHWARNSKNGTPGEAIKKYSVNCMVDGCDEKSLHVGLCSVHYHRNRTYGDALHPRQREAKGAALDWILSNSKYEGRDCLLWPFSKFTDGRGSLWVGGRAIVASRYMCVLTHGNPPTRQHEAAHSCGKGHLGCVNPNHLRWATAKENTNDKFIHGTVPQGANHWNSKLTSDQVVEIKNLIGKKTQDEIADIFGVSRGCISDIQRGATWAWLEDSQIS